ncbi:MAG: ABC transporter ATP-binding protein [Pseudomonadota bacterium]
MEPDTVLRTERLQKRFGGVVAADNVDLAVKRRELHCIIGPNGAGKSTLFALLCGIYRPDEGRIFFEDKEITQFSAYRRVREGLGMTFQTNRAYHNLSIRQNLEIPMKISRTTASEAAAERLGYALELFQIDAQSERAARELPHHKLQWLEILMVLASGPEVLLLDEPTAGMSPEETMHTARVLQHLNSKDLTVVVVEHDIAFVREVAQIVTVLHQGRIFAQGTIDDITAHDDVRRIYLGRA